MNEVYRLFDRRCCMDTALDKLKRLRRRIKRFLSLGETLKKLFSTNLEMILYCQQLLMRWNVQIAVIARCKKACIVCEPETI